MTNAELAKELRERCERANRLGQHTTCDLGYFVINNLTTILAALESAGEQAAQGQAEAFHAWALEWRGIEEPCSKCSGAGLIAYSSTSTWYSRAGGQTVTSSTCDECWGTGDARRKGADLRRLSSAPVPAPTLAERYFERVVAELELAREYCQAVEPCTACMRRNELLAEIERSRS